MSEPLAGLGASSLAAAQARAAAWHVRAASPADLPDIAVALTELLEELGGVAPPASKLEGAALEILANPELGRVLVAGAGESIIGVLAASRQHAVHVPGPYCLIQDLWVGPAWRSAGVGAALLQALLEAVRGDGIERVEVGLPSQRFQALAATESFYERNGFRRLGPRMRMMVS